jgi:putative membrane protein insertion efficiency factor
MGLVRKRNYESMMRGKSFPIKFLYLTKLRYLGSRALVVFLRVFILSLRQFLHVVSGVDACCRFTPSCSVYSRAAFKRYGFLKGFCLMMGRLLKCHPFGPQGYDPLPEEIANGV